MFVIGGEAPALGLSHDLRVRVDLWIGAGFAVSGSPVAFATLGLPAPHRRQSRWGRHGNRMVIHSRDSFSPCSVIKVRGASHSCWHGGKWFGTTRSGASKG